MGLWSAYFLAKLALYALAHMEFSPWLNLGLAVFTALPPQNARQRLAKNLIVMPLGILLVYYDSHLPPLAQAITDVQNVSSFSASYLWELAGRLISWKLLIELGVSLALYELARRKLRLSTFVFMGILVVLTAPHARFLQAAARPAPAIISTDKTRTDDNDLSPSSLDARLARFYREQSQVLIHFTRPAADDPPFDILILHVCSLSWDDLKTLPPISNTFFDHFNIVLSNFSSAASYSGPAAIRLLRGTCGQTPESRLYDPTTDSCLVIDGLQNVGFEPHWAMNHDGHFGNFFADVRDRGGLAPPLEDSSGALPTQTAFDGTPVYGDYSVLSHWWAKRQANPASRVVLYYNTISLHDGNRVLGADHPDSYYGARFATLSRDILRFMDLVRSSGRHVVVVFIAEHGAALRGDALQIQGLREIPTAAITTVPVGIALINADLTGSALVQKSDTPASYPALNEILSRLIASNPFARPLDSLSTYTDTLPRTDFVAENNGTTVIAAGKHYMMRSPDGAWSSLDGIDAGKP